MFNAPLSDKHNSNVHNKRTEKNTLFLYSKKELRNHFKNKMSTHIKKRPDRVVHSTRNVLIYNSRKCRLFMRYIILNNGVSQLLSL